MSIGKITCNFAMLEQLVSFCIWSMIEKDSMIVKGSKMLDQSGLKDLMQFCICTPVGLEKALNSKLGQIITAELSFRRKVELLCAIYKYRTENGDIIGQPGSFAELIGNVSKANDERNTISHSLWAIGDKEDINTRLKMTAKGKKGLQFQTENMSIQELNEIGDFIAEVAYDFQEFAVRIYQPGGQCGL